MDELLRYKRLRLLVKKLNAERKKQAKKIDILCKDLIAAQWDFIRSLDSISFAANFYRSIIAITDLSTLLLTAGRLIKERFRDANITFFLRRDNGFQLHMVDNNEPIGGEHHLEDCFTQELMDNINKANKLCTLDDMLLMGLQANPALLRRIWATTIPLGQPGQPVGFILIYRSAEHPSKSDSQSTISQLKDITAVTQGLSRAIQYCQMSAQGIGR